MDSIQDPYMQKIDEYWNEITWMYVTFEDKKPIIEFEPNRIRIIAYPAEEYLDGLIEPGSRPRSNTGRPVPPVH